MIELAWRKVGGSNNMRSLKEGGGNGTTATGAPGSAGSEFILNSSKHCTVHKKRALWYNNRFRKLPFM